MGHRTADDARQRLRPHRPARPRREPVLRGPARLRAARAGAAATSPSPTPTSASCYRGAGGSRTPRPSLREALRLAERVGRGPAAVLVGDLRTGRHPAGPRPCRRQAVDVAERYGFAPPYPSTIVLPDTRSVRGRLLIAIGRTKDGVTNWKPPRRPPPPGAAQHGRGPLGGRPGRRAGRGGPGAGRRALVTDARRQAERFGTDTAIGEALRCAAALETGQRAVTLAAQAVAYLEASPSGTNTPPPASSTASLARSRGRTHPRPRPGQGVRRGRTRDPRERGTGEPRRLKGSHTSGAPPRTSARS